MSVLDYKPKPWEPLVRAAMDPEEIERQRRLHEENGVEYVPDSEMWVNEEYQVTVRYLGDEGKASVLHLSIKRRAGGPAHDWRELQAIKNEVAGWEREAIEIYPSESRLVDQANQTHLWVLRDGESIGVGWPNRDVKTDEERKAELAKVIGVRQAERKGSQRNWRPGISTGPNYNPGG